MPNVFLSWSGDSSKQIAEVLHTWLPVALQSVKPFLSSEDLRKGGRWLSDLNGELAKESFGILCLTPSNLTAPWILYEAGALSKSLSESRVAPLLIGVKPSDLPEPLTQFNAVASDRNDFKRLVRSINELSGTTAVAADVVDKATDACWAQVENAIAAVLELPAPASDQAVEKDEVSLFEKIDPILQELLVLNRAQSQALLNRARENSIISDLESALHRERIRSDEILSTLNDVRDLLRSSDLSTPELRNAAMRVERALGDPAVRRRRRRISVPAEEATAPIPKLTLRFQIDASNFDQLDELLEAAGAASSSDVSWERDNSSVLLTFDPVPDRREADVFRTRAEDLGFRFLDEDVRV